MVQRKLAKNNIISIIMTLKKISNQKTPLMAVPITGDTVSSSVLTVVSSSLAAYAMMKLNSTWKLIPINVTR